jgi:hypothetical protein
MNLEEKTDHCSEYSNIEEINILQRGSGFDFDSRIGHASHLTNMLNPDTSSNLSYFGNCKVCKVSI